MSIKRYKADMDNTIVNAFQSNMSTRGTGSNSGQADVVEVYSVYGRQQQSSSFVSASQELSRILMRFPISEISTDRTATKIPALGKVSFYLRLFDAKTSKTVPRNYKLVVQAISRDWEEGDGLDLENYTDITRNGSGSNWMRASKAAAWTTVGGDYHAQPTYVQYFTGGVGDLEVNITSLVEQWIAGTKENYGVGIRLTSSNEAYFSNSAGPGGAGANSGSTLFNPDGAKTSYYTKRFFARGSQYFFKRPVIEARWDSTTKDDRSAFYFSSSLATKSENLNTLYFYNYVRGRLRNIPGIGTSNIYVSLYSGSSDDTAPFGPKLRLYDGSTEAVGGWIATGVYTCSVSLTRSISTPLETIYDIWHNNSGSEYYTGSIKPLILKGSTQAREPTYYLSITNLQNSYMKDQIARFNLYVREKNWSPTIYTKAVNNAPTETIYSASYRVIRTIDGFEAIPFYTASNRHNATGLSYDVSGNYFDLDMNLLQPGYEYAFKFAFYDDELGSWQEQNEEFKFRVEDYEH